VGWGLSPTHSARKQDRKGRAARGGPVCVTSP